jgi:DNA-binding NarL/FixJ family response regulator
LLYEFLFNILKTNILRGNLNIDHSQSMHPIKILIADDHPLVAESLALLLSSKVGFEIVGNVYNGLQAVDFVQKFDTDVLLVDYHMPILNGIEVISKLKQLTVPLKIILLTMNEEASFIKESIQVGADGYVMKSAGKDELIRAIETVYSGGKYFGEKVLKKLAEIPNNHSPTGKTQLQNIQSLTRREVEIVRLIAEDLSNVKIAERLGISSTTVETHRRNLMKKIGVSTAVGLVRWGMKNGILETF